jgi:hypothetical protein
LSGENAAPDYEVGYRRPPVAKRFKPGQTGNPRGKPRGDRSVKTILRTTLHEKIAIRTPRGIRKVSKIEALIQSMMNQALKGDAKARDQILRLAQDLGLDSDMVSAFDASAIMARTDEDIALLERYLGPSASTDTDTP